MIVQVKLHIDTVCQFAFTEPEKKIGFEFSIRDRDIVIQYIRDKKNCPVGVLVAVISPIDPENKFVIGWSLCNVNAGDVFNKNVGIGLAIQKAVELLSIGTGSLPTIVDNMMDDFYDRANLYFQDKQIGNWLA